MIESSELSRRQRRFDFFWISVILGVGFGIRLMFLFEPVRADESITFLWFARLPLRDIVITYPIPNNHILHSLIMHLAYRVFGISEWGLRLPVFLAGVCVPVLIYIFALAVTSNRRCAVLAGWMGAFSQGLVLYSTYGRGYMLQAFLSLMVGLLIFTSWMWSGRRRRVVLCLSIASWAILYLVPTGLIFVVPCFIYLGCHHPLSPRNRRSVWIAALVTIAWTTLSYAPVFQQMLHTAPDQTGLYSLKDYTADCLRLLSQGVLPSIVLVPLILFGMGSITRRSKPLGLFLLWVLGSFPFLNLLLYMAHFYYSKMFPRSYILVLPFAYLAAAAGANALWRRFSTTKPGFILMALLTTAGLGYMTHQLYKVVRDPQFLFYPNRSLRLSSRVLTRRLAPRLGPQERINGGAACDDVVAFYTVESRGFAGFYGIRDLYHDSVRSIYIIDTKSARLSFYEANLDDRLWTPPRVIDSDGDLQTYVTGRQQPRAPLTGAIRGYTD